MRRSVITRTLAVLFWTLPLAFANNDRSWVASTGSDANPCTRSLPCATFQVAADNTNAGGEVDVVDPGDYGPVHLFQGITIDGGGMARIESNPAAVFTVNISLLTPGTVTLRNLSIFGLPFPGLSGFSGWGVFAEQCGACNNSAYEVNLDHVKISGVSAAIQLNGVGTATITDSVIEDAESALSTEGNSATASVTVSVHQTIFNNSSGCAVCVSPNSTVTVDKSVITHNSIGVSVSAGTARLSDCTITDNEFGLFVASGSIISFVNNRIYGNGTNGAPTQSVYQR